MNDDSSLFGVRRMIRTVVLLGVVGRVGYWLLLPPDSRLFATFTPLDSSVVGYLLSFEGYKPGRMPLFDVINAVFWEVLSPILGVKSLTVFTLLCSVVSLYLFVPTVTRLFNEQVAWFGVILYALHPQFLQLTGTGYAEVTSASFVVFSLFAVLKGRETESVWWYLAAGILTTISYLLYVPAVLVSVILNLYVYSNGIRGIGLRRMLPNIPSVVYAVVPGIVGVTYLLVGPASSVAQRAAVGAPDEGFVKPVIFTDPLATIPLWEKVMRYIGIMYVDVWWHGEGFDHERHILQLADGLSVFFGNLFVAYSAGWIVVTLLLTACLAVGIVRSVRARSREHLFILSVIIGFFILDNITRLGWQGGFNVLRHTFPAFPIVAILFGIGAAALIDSRVFDSLTDVTNPFASLPHRQISRRVLLSGVLSLMLVGLVMNGAVHATVESDKRQVAVADPMTELTATIDTEQSSVGVFRLRDYNHMLMYSHGEIRPVIYATSESSATSARYKSTLADVRLINGTELTDYTVDYLFLRNIQCRKFSPTEQQLITEARQNGAIHSEMNTTRGGFRCSSFSAVVIDLTQLRNGNLSTTSASKQSVTAETGQMAL